MRVNLRGTWGPPPFRRIGEYGAYWTKAGKFLFFNASGIFAYTKL